MTATNQTGKKPTRRALRWAIEIAVVLVIILSIRAWVSRDLALGEAPSLDSRLLDGTPVNVAHFANEPYILHFWATWCRICRFEESEIARLSENHPVLTVAMQSGTRDEVEAYLSERERGLAVVNDPEGRIAQRFGVRAVPSTFIIDGGGRIVYRKQGFAPPLELRVRLWLARGF